MAKNVIINGVTYNDLPAMSAPLAQGSGDAVFYDTSDATLDNGNKMLSGNTAYANGVKYTGSIASKAAETYTPTTNDQIIAAGQYLSGAQTVKGDNNLVSGNIVSGITIFGISGSVTLPVITQDPTTKILHIA